MAIEDDFHRLESKVDKLTDAVMRLVLIEERQSSQGERIGKCEIAIAQMDTANQKTERLLHMWINRGIGVWITVGALWTFFQLVIKK